MEIRWNETPRAAWDEAMRHAAWQQGWAYGAAVASPGWPVHRAAIVEEGETIGHAQFAGRRLLKIAHVATCTRGPVWSVEAGEGARREAYRLLRATIPLPRPRGVFFTPDAAEEAGPLRAARLRQVMSPYSTATLDLTRPDDALLRAMRGKWRNRLRRAEEARIEVTVERAEPGSYDALLRAEEAQQRARRYRALPPALVPAWQARASAREGVMVATAHRDGARLGAMLFLVHGAGALYHIGVTGPAGRAVSAHALTLWRAMGALRDRGVETLDLGGLDTVDAPGIARFKLGSGAAVRTLCGTWC